MMKKSLGRVFVNSRTTRTTFSTHKRHPMGTGNSRFHPNTCQFSLKLSPTNRRNRYRSDDSNLMNKQWSLCSKKFSQHANFFGASNQNQINCRSGCEWDGESFIIALNAQNRAFDSCRLILVLWTLSFFLAVWVIVVGNGKSKWECESQMKISFRLISVKFSSRRVSMFHAREFCPSLNDSRMDLGQATSACWTPRRFTSPTCTTTVPGRTLTSGSATGRVPTSWAWKFPTSSAATTSSEVIKAKISRFNFQATSQSTTSIGWLSGASNIATTSGMSSYPRISTCRPRWDKPKSR